MYGCILGNVGEVSCAQGHDNRDRDVKLPTLQLFLSKKTNKTCPSVNLHVEGGSEVGSQVRVKTKCEQAH